MTERPTHRIKSWPENFRAVLTGRKTFEVRRDDRPYATGDAVLLQEFDPMPAADSDDPNPLGYTGRQALYLIGHVDRGPFLPPGWCAFQIVTAEEMARVAPAVVGRDRGTL